MSSLFVIKGRDQGKKFELSEELLRTEDPMRIGRDTDNSIKVNDAEASRHHAEIRKLEKGGFELLDLNSSNGTFINEHKIKAHRLLNGDRIRIGRTVLIYTESNQTPPLDQSDLVRIVQTPLPESASRIVSTISVAGTESAKKLIAGKSENLAGDSLELVYQTALAVSQTLDVDELLDKLMQMIFGAIHPDRGCILLHDAESQQMLPRISRSKAGKQNPEDRLEISSSIVDYVVKNCEGVLTSDAINDQRWDSEASIISMGVNEAICVPMQGRYETPGVIYVDTRTPPGQYAGRPAASKFTEEHLKLMVAIGHQAALAIEDTQFYSAMIHSERMAAMGQTIATLSHHIKNILQGINGGSYLVTNGIEKNALDVIASGWKIVEKNQAKISQLVMDMLSFSKEREPDWATGQINEVVADVVELMEHRAMENNVSITWQPDDSVPECLFDAEAIHRAVLNVVSNAIDALEGSERPGEIQVETKHNTEQSRVEIWVSDNGEGIPEDFLPKIFGVFESGKGQRGTGLGLPVSRKIMNEHQGDISVESQIGEGAKFCLFLPIQPTRTQNTIEIPSLGNREEG